MKVPSPAGFSKTLQEEIVKQPEHYLSAITAAPWSGGSTPAPSAERNGELPVENFENDEDALIK